MKNPLFLIGFVLIGLGNCYLLMPPATVANAVSGIFSAGGMFVFIGIIKAVFDYRKSKEPKP